MYTCSFQCLPFEYWTNWLQFLIALFFFLSLLSSLFANTYYNWNEIIYNNATYLLQAKSNRFRWFEILNSNSMVSIKISACILRRFSHDCSPPIILIIINCWMTLNDRSEFPYEFRFFFFSCSWANLVGNWSKHFDCMCAVRLIANFVHVWGVKFFSSLAISICCCKIFYYISYLMCEMR